MIRKFHASAGMVLKAIVGVGFMMAGAVSGAQAQQQQQQGPQQTAVEQHGSWVYECSKQGPNGTEFCTIQQQISDAETEQVLLNVTIAYHPQSAQLLMVSLTPLGVDLPLGVGLKVDAGPQLAAPYSTCTPQGCRAAAPLTDELIGSLKAGNTMLISYSYRGKRLDSPVSLTGFTAALNKLALKRPTPTAPAQ